MMHGLSASSELQPTAQQKVMDQASLSHSNFGNQPIEPGLGVVRLIAAVRKLHTCEGVEAKLHRACYLHE